METAVKEAAQAKTMGQIHDASRQMDDTIGSFGVNSLISVGGYKIGATVADHALMSDKLSGFATAKADFWNSVDSKLSALKNGSYLPGLAQLRSNHLKEPQLELKNGSASTASPADQPGTLESTGIKEAVKATGARSEAELPRLILLKQQFDAAARQAQIERVAGELANFIGGANKSINTAVYDFRLSDPKVESTVINAYNKAAENGIDVKIAFFRPPARAAADIAQTGGAEAAAEVPLAEGPSPELLAKLSPKIHVQVVEMSDAKAPTSGADALDGTAAKEQSPEPVKGHEIDLQNGQDGNLGSDVGVNGIEGEGHLMHDKYVVTDAGKENARVWTGSTNFTDDAFGSQDNNIAIFKSQVLADAYAKDFDQMWQTGKLTDTGAGLHATAAVGDGSLTVAFSPGDGDFIDSEFAKRFADAQNNVRLASMVISSPQMLQALVDDIHRGIKVTGIYDGPQMDQVERNWSKFPSSASKLALWDELKKVLVRKNSHPYTPNGIHDFLHNKMYEVDDQNAGTGSFNFSKNATKNAENVLMMDNLPEIAQQYAHYIDDLIKTYDGKPMQGDPVTDTPEAPVMTPEEALSTFKELVSEGKIPHGKFVDSIVAQTYPLTAKQLAVVLRIIAKAQSEH